MLQLYQQGVLQY